MKQNAQTHEKASLHAAHDIVIEDCCTKTRDTTFMANVGQMPKASFSRGMCGLHLDIATSGQNLSGDCRETSYIDRCMKVLNTYWCQPVAMFIMQEHIEALSL